jgi:non-homologous end joining protein Ku
MSPKAKAPTRGDKITISFGLVNIPVVLYNSIDDEGGKITRQMRTAAGNAVAFSTADKVTGEIVERSATHMVYVTPEGEVELSDEEIAAAMAQENGTSEIIGVYDADAIQDRFTAGYRQVRPQTVKVGTKNTRPYDKVFGLFMAQLAATDSVVVLRYTLRGKPQMGALDGWGWMHVFHWDEEVREELPLGTDGAVYTEAELDMAGQLLQAYVKKELPDFHNDGIAKVREYAEAKAKGVAKAPSTEAPVQTNADDLMAQLMASVENAKKSK